MNPTVESRNKALILEAFDPLFTAEALKVAGDLDAKVEALLDLIAA